MAFRTCSGFEFLLDCVRRLPAQAPTVVGLESGALELADLDTDWMAHSRMQRSSAKELVHWRRFPSIALIDRPQEDLLRCRIGLERLVALHRDDGH